MTEHYRGQYYYSAEDISYSVCLYSSCCTGADCIATDSQQVYTNTLDKYAAFAQPNSTTLHSLLHCTACTRITQSASALQFTVSKYINKYAWDLPHSLSRLQRISTRYCTAPPAHVPHNQLRTDPIIVVCQYLSPRSTVSTFTLLCALLMQDIEHSAHSFNRPHSVRDGARANAGFLVNLPSCQ